jgi:hypothetical protein
MPPRHRSLLRAPAAIGWLVLTLLAAGCAASFDPSGPCTTDGRAAGAYPDLEALVPHELGGETADAIDSGRNCSAAALGSLASHGVTELRFAGSTWDNGANAGVSSAIFAAPDLRADWVHEFYKTGAESGRNTEQVISSTTDVDGNLRYRIDTLNGESYQSVVNWQDGDRVRVVLVASFIRDTSKALHDRLVETAVAETIGAEQP